MYSIIILLLLFTLFVLTQTQHAVIGSYGEINATLCGLTKESMKFTDKCFQWHKNRGSEMSAARNATTGESPWTVLVRGKTEKGIFLCTGSIIDPQWVLTAAHCLLDPMTEITIKTGNKREENEMNLYIQRHFHVFPHPKYDSKSPTRQSHDIGLIQLSKKIPIVKELYRLSYIQNTICLPERNITNTGPEYILMSGWGRVEEQGLGLQIGHRRMTLDPESEQAFMHFALNRSNRVCEGDSGGPLWQYDNGRAVLIGVESLRTLKGKLDQYKCTVDRSSAHAVRVSQHIDWILNTIRDNK